MKIFLRSVLCLLFLGLIRSETGFENDQKTPEVEKKICHHQILQFYGLEGRAEAHRPEKTDQDGALRRCPEIEYSCCSRDDFLRTQQLWEENLLNVKGYLTKIFRIIQKMIMLQSSLVQVAQKASTLENKKCSEIDITFFNPPISFKEIYSYLMAAFQSMAYIQKGFYCTICDAKNQPFLMVKQDFSRLSVQISEKSCNDLIYRFKEFIMYKTYYFDNFLVNATKLFNCVDETQEFQFEPSYTSQYQEIKSCVETGNNCHIVCNEFRLGGFSSLFMGDIHDYEKFHDSFLDFSSKYKIDINEITNEVLVPDYSFTDNDFFKQKEELGELEQQELNYGRVSNMSIIIGKEGIDLFGTAENSNYFLMDQSSSIEKNRIYNISNEGGDSLLEKGIPETPLEQAHNKVLEADGLTHEQNEEDDKKMLNLPSDSIPTQNQLDEIKNEISIDENERDNFRRKNGTLEDYDPRNDNPSNNDFTTYDGNTESTIRYASAMIVVLLALLS